MDSKKPKKEAEVVPENKIQEVTDLEEVHLAASLPQRPSQCFSPLAQPVEGSVGEEYAKITISHAAFPEFSIAVAPDEVVDFLNKYQESYTKEEDDSGILEAKKALEEYAATGNIETLNPYFMDEKLKAGKAEDSAQVAFEKTHQERKKITIDHLRKEKGQLLTRAYAGTHFIIVSKNENEEEIAQLIKCTDVQDDFPSYHTITATEFNRKLKDLLLQAQSGKHFIIKNSRTKLNMAFLIPPDKVRKAILTEEYTVEEVRVALSDLANSRKDGK